MRASRLGFCAWPLSRAEAEPFFGSPACQPLSGKPTPACLSSRLHAQAGRSGKASHAALLKARGAAAFEASPRCGDKLTRCGCVLIVSIVHPDAREEVTQVHRLSLLRSCWWALHCRGALGCLMDAVQLLCLTSTLRFPCAAISICFCRRQVVSMPCACMLLA